MVSEGGIQIARSAREHRTTADDMSNQPGISGCPGQRLCAGKNLLERPQASGLAVWLPARLIGMEPKIKIVL